MEHLSIVSPHVDKSQRLAIERPGHPLRSISIEQAIDFPARSIRGSIQAHGK